MNRDCILIVLVPVNFLFLHLFSPLCRIRGCELSSYSIYLRTYIFYYLSTMLTSTILLK